MVQVRTAVVPTLLVLGVLAASTSAQEDIHPHLRGRKLQFGAFGDENALNSWSDFGFDGFNITEEEATQVAESLYTALAEVLCDPNATTPIPSEIDTSCLSNCVCSTCATDAVPFECSTQCLIRECVDDFLGGSDFLGGILNGTELGVGGLDGLFGDGGLGDLLGDEVALYGALTSTICTNSSAVAGGNDTLACLTDCTCGANCTTSAMPFDCAGTCIKDNCLDNFFEDIMNRAEEVAGNLYNGLTEVLCDEDLASGVNETGIDTTCLKDCVCRTCDMDAMPFVCASQCLQEQCLDDLIAGSDFLGGILGGDGSGFDGIIGDGNRTGGFGDGTGGFGGILGDEVALYEGLTASLCVGSGVAGADDRFACLTQCACGNCTSSEMPFDCAGQCIQANNCVSGFFGGLFDGGFGFGGMDMGDVALGGGDLGIAP